MILLKCTIIVLDSKFSWSYSSNKRILKVFIIWNFEDCITRVRKHHYGRWYGSNQCFWLFYNYCWSISNWFIKKFSGTFLVLFG